MVLDGQEMGSAATSVGKHGFPPMLWKTARMTPSIMDIEIA